MSVNDIKKLIKNENLIIGSDRVLKGIRNNELEKVFLAQNAPAGLVEDIKRYSLLVGAELEMLDVPNDELGTLCKKPFAISCLGLKKAVEKKKR